MEQFIAIVRHGDYSGGSDTSPLSEFGQKQMNGIREVLDKHLEREEGRNRSKRLHFSFSSTRRAIESSTILSLGGDIVVTELFLTEREDVREPQNIVDKVLGLLNYYNVTVAVIVAHGDMPAVIAEVVNKNGTCSEKVERLPSLGKGKGYFVNVQTGHVLYITPEGLTEVPKPQPESVEIPVTKQVEVLQPVLPISQRNKKAKKHEEVRQVRLFDPIPDDDIPF